MAMLVVSAGKERSAAIRRIHWGRASQNIKSELAHHSKPSLSSGFTRAGEWIWWGWVEWGGAGRGGVDR
eukprot:scaffold88632_cov30-Tisochrysis_lutea.AAC.1